MQCFCKGDHRPTEMKKVESYDVNPETEDVLGFYVWECPRCHDIQPYERELIEA